MNNSDTIYKNIIEQNDNSDGDPYITINNIKFTIDNINAAKNIQYLSVLNGPQCESGQRSFKLEAV